MKLKFKEGINEKQIRQLIEYSAVDEKVEKFTSDKERFKDRQAFEEWKQKGREIFILTNENDDLLGIIWIGKKEIGLENYDKTFAIRIYGEARGKGLALDFMKKSLKEKGYWLECSADNLPAQILYKNFGFKQIGGVDENGKVVMVY